MNDEQRLLVHTPHETRSIVIVAEDYARDLSEVLRRADMPLNTRCGRRRLCDGCLVEVKRGSLWSTSDGGEVSASESGAVRACDCRLGPGADVEIYIPARSLLAHAPQIVASFRCNVSYALDPLWQRVRLDAVPKSGVSLDREAVARLIADSSARNLPVVADASIEPVTDAELGGRALVREYRGEDWLVRDEPLPHGGPKFGIAVDIGTTTVVASLIDLATGEVRETASALNAQIALGDNVVTRINLCTQDKAHIRELQEAVVEKSIGVLIDQLIAEAGSSGGQVVTLCLAGNTTMLHLFAGADPSSLGVAPFTPQFLNYVRVPMEELPFATNSRSASSAPAGARYAPGAAAHLLPSAGAYVGADITAGVFASGMIYRREPCLLVDIGTNGEIVLIHDGHLIGCATAAGPAFEGAGMSFGVRAGTGAISHVRLTEKPLTAEIEVIGGGLPIGFCGTGYVDLVAQARMRDLIGRTGRMTAAGMQCELMHVLPRGRGFRLATGRGGEPLVVSEADIACLMQAKAAIAAGILCLLARFGLEPRDIDTVYLAGGFGFHMDLKSLIGCGILPGFDPSQIEIVGNTSLAGAYLALIDAGALEEIKRLSGQMEIVELNLEPNFASCYIDQLFLP